MVILLLSYENGSFVAKKEKYSFILQIYKPVFNNICVSSLSEFIWKYSVV